MALYCYSYSVNYTSRISIIHRVKSGTAEKFVTDIFKGSV